MKLPDKVYEILKWICLIFCPALITFITAIFAIYHIPNVEVVTGTIAAIATFIGTLIGISTASYNKANLINFDAGKGEEDDVIEEQK